MARSYWECLQWEFKQRKNAMVNELAMNARCTNTKSCATHLHEVDHTLLHNPTLDGEKEEIYLAQGSFGVVKMKLFRGM